MTLVPPTEGLRVARYAQGAGYSPDQWARALTGVDWSQAELLSDKTGSSVWRAALVVQKRPQALVIKCEPIDSLKRRVQALFRKTHAHRHWRGAELLMRHGFRTAEPKAIVYGVRDGVTVECLIMEALNGKTVLEHLAAGDLSVREEHALAGLMGAQVQILLDRRIFNRDHKASNLFVIEAREGSDIALLDCVGLRRRRTNRHVAMLASVYIEAVGVGHPPRRSLLMRALLAHAAQCLAHARRDLPTWGVDDSVGARREFSRSTWRLVAERIVAHGDPTPLHDPLSRPVRLDTAPTDEGGVV